MTENEKTSAVAAVTKDLERYKKDGANLLMPSTHIAGLSEYHQPVIDTVTLSSNPEDGDVYAHDNADPGPNKKWRPTKQALMKLSVCAGVIWSPTETRRVDNGADRNYIAYRAVGGIKKADGQPVFFSGEYDLDFEVLEEELFESYTKKTANAKWAKDKGDAFKAKYVDDCVKRDLLQKRKHKLKLCEAGAMNRVLRMLLGLKQAYTTRELEQPFVMARIVFRPDFSDAAVRKQFVDASIKAMTGIYGPQALDQEIRDTKPIDITPLPEEENYPEPEPPPAGEPPESKPTMAESALIDFENSDVPGQCRSIFNLAVTKGYDTGDYLARAQVEKLSDLAPMTRAGLFKHLLSLPDKTDVPY